MGAPPRVVIVTRATELEELVARHGTREQARFFLERRDQRIEEVEARHHALHAVLARVSQGVPVRWRRARVSRGDLARFVWEPGDVVAVIGQDGLVANVAKYLDGQRVIGVNPDRARIAGVLVRHDENGFEQALRTTVEDRSEVQARTMVEASLDDGQRLLALNEVFVGHRSHQSARYRIAALGRAERQSSSGVIVATGTGSTGWARSIARACGAEESLPGPTDRSLAFFVREAWPSKDTGATLVRGVIDERTSVELTSEMGDGGVVFGDGIEDDHLTIGWGVRATVRLASQRLQLVV